MRYLTGILALGGLIALHELGHMLMARLFGVRVPRFAIGFGPAIFTTRRGDTEYVLGAIPFGGYVRIQGMDLHDDEGRESTPGSYASLARWRRMLILAAGPLANGLLAYLLLFTLFLTGTHLPVPGTIGAVIPGSEAARAQLRPGDRIVSVDGSPVDGWSSFAERIAESPGRTLRLGILREGQPQEIQVSPRADESDIGRIGVGQQYVFRRLPPPEAATAALVHIARLTAEIGAQGWKLLRGKPGVELSSPIGIVQQTAEATAGGLDAFLRALVALSLALALFNLLPIPALDGGRLAFLFLEATTGRRAGRRVEATVHALGFLALVALLLWVAARDVRKLWHAAEAHPSPVQTSPLAAGEDP